MPDNSALQKIGLPVPPERDDASLPSKASEASSGPFGNAFSSLRENPLFTGGLAIAAMGAAAQLLRKSSTRALQLARRQMLVTVEIPSSDPSYEWFLHFLANHQRQGAALEAIPGYSLSALLSRFRPAPRELAVETRTMKTPSGAAVADFVLVPGQGRHIINYNSTLLQIERMRDSKRMNPNGTPFETVEVTTLFSRRSVLTEMLRESQAMAMGLAEGKTTVYMSRGIEWQRFGAPQRKRPLSSVILAQGVKERVVNDLHDFMSAADWYRDRGIPYRRGYLLYGPPGTGKTSFVKAIAGELDYNICLINLSERGLTDDRLNHLLSNMPERSIALLEDVDAAFANRTQTAEDGYRGANVTFSGLLNAIDGAASGEDRIIMLTTNHADRLDEALLRPGRVDMKVEIGYATKEVVDGMWERFYGPDNFPESTEGLKKRFLEILEKGQLFNEDRGVSTAELQGMFLFFKSDPQGVVQQAENLVGARG
ncbi:P-loop containing nucleoside triphosphate hydrolase protein [Pyronema domesticum]|uniref:Similar to Mitochondrial chaperone BCS1 acc. no. P32839 n=1 Tax=Pyronema omphalodes (strain CBS 100304) TaxID=1076935 RepID=U4KWF6_PYROM|nr:P-loop containing nucleoside triphosphate hydrolase protein [Pyronema domesticum]CCX05812.1 Similar to Mitochondrial chaperone BCS1; acc. no. P32839 [Pyronema omphalodes CBS 100304]